MNFPCLTLKNYEDSSTSFRQVDNGFPCVAWAPSMCFTNQFLSVGLVSTIRACNAISGSFPLSHNPALMNFLMCFPMLWGFFHIFWQSLQWVHISYDGLACGPLDLTSWRSFHTTQLWWPALSWPLKSFFFLSSFPHSSHSSLVDFVWHLSCDLTVHFFC